jgi:hypothetical protein
MQDTSDNHFATSFSQQYTWFLTQVESDTNQFHHPNGWRIHGELDTQALERSLNTLVDRHMTLRTTFHVENGLPVQRVHNQFSIELRPIDLGGDPSQAGHHLEDEAQRPFDLLNGPLIRAALIKLDEGEHIFLLTLHHIISDGWSMDVLIHELSVLYRAFSTGQPSPLSDLPIQYVDFAVWQRQWLNGEVLQAQLDYWKRTLDGAPPLLELPVDHPRPAVLTHHGASVAFDLGAELSAQLRQLSQRTQATLFMTMAAAFNVLLQRYSRQDDICIGYPVANRNRTELESLIGFFVNTLVLRTQL